MNRAVASVMECHGLIQLSVFDNDMGIHVSASRNKSVKSMNMVKQAKNIVLPCSAGCLLSPVYQALTSGMFPAVGYMLNNRQNGQFNRWIF